MKELKIKGAVVQFTVPNNVELSVAYRNFTAFCLKLKSNLLKEKKSDDIELDDNLIMTVIADDCYDKIRRALFQFIVVSGVGELNKRANLEKALSLYGKDFEVLVFQEAMMHYIIEDVKKNDENDKSSPVEGTATKEQAEI